MPKQKAMRNLIYTLVILGIFFAFTGCYQKIEVTEVEGFSNIELSINGIKSDLTVKIFNPNFLNFHVSSADIILSIGDIEAGDLVLEKGIQLESRDTTEVSLKLISRKGAIGKIMIDNFTNALSGGDVVFKAEGEIISQIWGLKKRLPFSHEEVLEL